MNGKYIVCVDSDGCVIDGMTIKHELCFGPSFIDVYELGEYREELMEYWLDFNLYSNTRGVNRFMGLKCILQYAIEKGYLITNIDTFVEWVDTTDELSNQSLLKAMEACKSMSLEMSAMEKAVEWSKETNRRITQLTPEQKVAFSEASVALKTVKEYANLAVVSSANKAAVIEEWEHEDLLKYVDVLYTQEEGSKAECLKKLIAMGYEPQHIIMLGDSPGDIAAAKASGVLYYPIVPKEENTAWEEFTNQYFRLFLEGKYGNKVMEELVEECFG